MPGYNDCPRAFLALNDLHGYKGSGVTWRSRLLGGNYFFQCCKRLLKSGWLENCQFLMVKRKCYIYFGHCSETIRILLSSAFFQLEFLEEFWWQLPTFSFQQKHMSVDFFRISIKNQMSLLFHIILVFLIFSPSSWAILNRTIYISIKARH